MLENVCYLNNFQVFLFAEDFYAISFQEAAGEAGAFYFFAGEGAVIDVMYAA